MKRFALVLFFLFSISFLTSKFHIVLADGMVIHHNPYSNSNRFDYSPETDQQAYINYQNGLEKMIVSIKFDGSSDNSVWIFPIPAKPNNVAIDIIKTLPKFSGEDVSQKAKSNLYEMKKLILQTQIYTTPIISFYEARQEYQFTNSGSMTLAGGNSSGFKLPIIQDVTVYEHLDKEGMTSEVITAKTANGLYQYLKNKGLNVESNTIPVLDSYIGKDYSFIVSWIPSVVVTREEVEVIATKKLHNWRDEINKLSQFGLLVLTFTQKHQIERDRAISTQPVWYEIPDLKEEFINDLFVAAQKDPAIIDRPSLSRQKGIFVSFPSPEIYFPLIPTSVYQDVSIPASIRIIGHNSPKIPKTINNFTKIKYFFQNVMNVESDLTGFFSNDTPSGKYPYTTFRDIKYTKIDINAPSKLLTEDLWIKPLRPKKILISNFIIQYPVIFGLVLYIAISVLTGITIGLILFKDLRRNVIKLGLIGASNCLSLFSLIFVTKMVRTKNISDEAKSLLAEIKNKGYLWKRRIAFVFLFIVTPCLVIPLIIILNDLIMSQYVFNYSQYTYFLFPYLSYFFENLASGLGIIFIPIAMLGGSLYALVRGLLLKRIKNEDKILFERLKALGFSTWTFQPKDNRKFAFIILYSLTFLETTIFVVKIVEKIL